MHQRLATTEHMRLRSVLRKPGYSKKQRGRSVTFNESLNLFYEAECSCWIHEDDYARLRQEEHERREREEERIFAKYEPPPVEFEDPPTLSPPEGYKDRFFPQEMSSNNEPDVTRVSPPSPPAARRKVFLKESPSAINGQDEDDADDLKKIKTSRLGGILKGGRLWRSNSAEGKKVTTSPDEPDVVKCAEHSTHIESAPTKVSTGTAPLRTSEQIRLAVDSTLRSRQKKKPECSSLVEKLRWLTSLDDDDSSDSQASGFATWPSRDKNGTLTKSAKSDAGTCTTEEFVQSSSMRHPSMNVNEAKIRQISYILEDIDEGLKMGDNELESFITEDGERIERLRKRYGDDVCGDDYGFSRRPSVKGIKPKFSPSNQIFAQFSMRNTPIPQMMMTPNESQYENTRVPEDSGGVPGPAGDVMVGAAPPPPHGSMVVGMMDNARINYEFANAPGRQSEETRAHYEMIRQSCEPYGAYNRPHSWSGTNNLLPSAETLPPGAESDLQGMNVAGQQQLQPQHQQQHQQQQQQQQQQQKSIQGGVVQPQVGQGGMPPPSGHMSYPIHQNIYGTLPHPSSAASMYGQYGPGPPRMQQPMYGTLTNNMNGPGDYGPHHGPMTMQSIGQQQQQQMYGTVRRVPNVIGRPLFLHYGALSVEAHPNKIVYPRGAVPGVGSNNNKVPETPSPTQQPPPIRYYGPPIRYYNPPPPVPPRTAASSLSSSAQNNPSANNGSEGSSTETCKSSSEPSDHERGVPEGATDEEPSTKEPYSMNV